MTDQGKPSMPSSKLSDLHRVGEFGLISRFKSLLKYSSSNTVLGMGDDCAVYKISDGHCQVASTDALVEGVHFDIKTHSPEILGHKALAVNVSDIAAMGAVPKIAMVSLAIPDRLSVKFLDQFYRGLNRASQKYKVEVVGGDTVSSPKHFFINISIIGEARKNRIFTRKQARVGDKIYVTGTLGDSSLGLKILSSSRKKWKGPAAWQKILIHRHLSPEPRLFISQALAKSNLPITSMIDVSDGLVQDLAHICRDSGVGANILESRIPRARALTKFCDLNKLDANNFILSGGEDYELLFTLNAENDKKLKSSFLTTDVPVTFIGEVVDAPGKIFLEGDNAKRNILQKPEGFNHFKK